MKIVLTFILINIFILKTTVAKSCKADFNYTINGSYVTFTNTSIGTNLTCIWNFGDGSQSASCLGDSAHYYSNGIYYVTLTVIDSGCIDSKLDTIFINNNLNCNALFGITTPSTSNFNVIIYNYSLSKNRAIFNWDFGDGTLLANTISPTHTYSKFGKYPICLTLIDSACTSSFCNSIGMDSTGRIYKNGAFSFKVIDKTTILKNSSTLIINPIEKNEIISVNPNPFSNKIDIKNLKPNCVIQLKNVYGQVVFEGIYNDNLDFSHLKNGLYFLNILSNYHLTVKLIKQ